MRTDTAIPSAMARKRFDSVGPVSGAWSRLWRPGALLAVSWLAGGCAAFQYYAQAASGQLEVLRTSRPIETVIAHPDTEAALRDRLLVAEDIVGFAESELGLDAGKSYRRYAAIGRPFVVWNLFAAPPLSLDSRRWCYPFVGCVPYRGYFNRDAALRAEARLARRGYETYVAGVSAYSTLGWFDDPLLSTFIGWSEPRLAELLLHEISHQRVWVRDDAAFNESFAMFAGETGARLWFRKIGREGEFDAYLASRQGWQRFRALLLATRARLESVYRQGGDEELRYREKARVLEAFRHCYRKQKPSLGGGAFDALVEVANNAYLGALGTYTDWYPAFAALYRQAGGWTGFLDAVDALARLAPEERKTALRTAHPKRHAGDGEVDAPRCDVLEPETFPGGAG
ncbi:MAG: aminopeptidase [Gammaproteobacteria bacterium]|nr:aminopeptidase [Gammaproteobacteria bacterium]